MKIFAFPTRVIEKHYLIEITNIFGMAISEDGKILHQDAAGSEEYLKSKLLNHPTARQAYDEYCEKGNWKIKYLNNILESPKICKLLEDIGYVVDQNGKVSIGKRIKI